MKEKERLVLLIGGEGGHFEQLKRLTNNLELNNTRIVIITDFLKKKINQNIIHKEIGALRGKDAFNLIDAFSYFFLACKYSFSYCYKYRVSIISTGPGISLIPSLIVKLFGGKVIHIETWSRFYSKSGAGKLMYLIADKFYIQNKELSSVYPKGIYAGRL